MARQKLIPDEIREQVIAKVNAFNAANTKPITTPPAITKLLRELSLLPPRDDGLSVGSYVPRFKGAFLYLDRVGSSRRPSEICRLKWTGDMNDWEFAIYRHSRNAYDPHEWMFPGAGEVNGTVEGAMRAGMGAYPV